MVDEEHAMAEALREERRRLRYLRTLVDLTAQVIKQERPTRGDAEQLVEATRRRVLELFPGKEHTYDLIYRPRFERLIREFARPGGKLLRFRRPPDGES